ncbi:MAG TPA: DUF1622 domain-containing protein [Candidatus Dorea intestinavium]|nr:DUF1622 domain-containing protein [Candidatus Dorea intestinavium]
MAGIGYFEKFLEIIAQYAIVGFELVGVAVIVYTGIKGAIKSIKKEPDTRVVLAKGLSLGLEFKLGSEILRTVVVREWKEIAIVGGIIILRAALNFLIHWELKEEEAQLNRELEREGESND